MFQISSVCGKFIPKAFIDFFFPSDVQWVLFRMVSACGETLRNTHWIGTYLHAALLCTLALTVSRGFNSAEPYISNALKGFVA